jgi:hypothetical protein
VRAVRPVLWVPLALRDQMGRKGYLCPESVP